MRLPSLQRINVWITALTLLVTVAPSAQAQTTVPFTYGVENNIFHFVTALHGIGASVDKTATEVGVAILRQGGNAVNAVVAVGVALAVTHPQAGNLGGDGFMLLSKLAGQTAAIDFREMATPKDGVVHIIQILNILENFDLAKMGASSANAILVMSEAIKYAYADHSQYLGDPVFV